MVLRIWVPEAIAGVLRYEFVDKDVRMKSDITNRAFAGMMRTLEAARWIDLVRRRQCSLAPEEPPSGRMKHR